MVPRVFVSAALPGLLFLSLVGFVAPLGAQPATFTDLQDLVPGRCFSAALSTVGDEFVDIGIESGFNPQTWTNNTCKASTAAFHTGTAGDTFLVTASAPPGMRITRVSYEQAGTRYLERSTYWQASGTGILTVNGVPLTFSFTTPTLVKTVTLAEPVASVSVSIKISLSAKRNSAFPRVTNAPGSASIGVTDAVIRVEYEAADPGGSPPPPVEPASRFRELLGDGTEPRGLRVR